MTSTLASPAGTVPVGGDRPAPPALHRQAGYRLWWGADTSALLAGSVYQFALPLILLAVTGSPAQAGSLAALGTAARVGTTLFGGVLADRLDRGRLMVASGAIGAGLAALLALLAWVGAAGAAVLCVGHVLLELRSGLFGSVTNAALKDVVHPAQLGRAMAANEGRDAALMLGAPPLGGAVLALGPAAALGVVALGQLTAALFGGRLAPVLRACAGHAEAPARPRPGGIRAGLAWFRTRPALRVLLFAIVTVNLGTNGALTSLVYGLRERGESPAAIGLASAGMGVGLLAGALAATWLIDRISTGWLTCLALASLSLFLLLVPVRGELWWIGAMLALAYAGVPALNAAIGGYIMALAPRDMAGRANATVLFTALLAMPLAPLAAGAGIEFLGLAPTVLGFAVLVVAATLICLGSASVRSIPGPAQWARHGDATAPATTSADHSLHARKLATVRARERARHAVTPQGQWIHV